MTPKNIPDPEKNSRRKKSREETDLIWQKVLETDSRREEVHRRLSAQFQELSKTDIKVAVLLREGLASWQIGGLLKVKDHTVENHRTRIHKILQIPRSHDLSAFFKGF